MDRNNNAGIIMVISQFNPASDSNKYPPPSTAMFLQRNMEVILIIPSYGELCLNLF